MKFFNTYSGTLEEFKPLDPKAKEVKMYACGPTVYDYAHIGNFRTFVFEDLLRRFLEYKGFRVNHVMNITDVDDKTIAGAQKEGKTLPEFIQKYISAFNEDLKTLNILPPTQAPRATNEIPEMISLIEKLIKNGAAYVSDDSVYYRVDSFKNYGKLSKKNLEKNIKGARVDVDEYEKEDGSDFVLWKKAKEGEPAWDSPWGKGRPGWHIECSAMSMKHLGEAFDIHVGGEDLIFPHHENEIAQSEGATGKKFVSYWLHAKHLLVNGEKMSKSKGNFYTLRDLLAKGYDPMAIRYALLSVHYRSQLNFTLEGLREANEVIEKLDDCYFSIFSQMLDPSWHEKIPEKPLDYDFLGRLNSNLSSIGQFLESDLNVSGAFSILFEIIRLINKALSEKRLNGPDISNACDFFHHIDDLFGFGITIVDKNFKDIEDLYKLRTEIRNDPNFKNSIDLQKKSDELRIKAEKRGWFLKDGRPGEFSTVKKKRRAWDQ